MASLITHPVAPLAVAAVLGRTVVTAPLLVVGVLFSILPDVDAAAFRFGIPYASPFGHRGFSHSICVALICAALVVPLARKLGTRPLTVFLFLFFAMLSHGVLDAFTNQGKGVAFFWPFSDARLFFDFHPVEASPLSVRRFLSDRGIRILLSELQWIWAPLMGCAAIGYGVRKMMTRKRCSEARQPTADREAS